MIQYLLTITCSCTSLRHETISCCCYCWPNKSNHSVCVVLLLPPFIQLMKGNPCTPTFILSLADTAGCLGPLELICPGQLWHLAHAHTHLFGHTHSSVYSKWQTLTLAVSRMPVTAEVNCCHQWSLLCVSLSQDNSMSDPTVSRHPCVCASCFEMV